MPCLPVKIPSPRKKKREGFVLEVSIKCAWAMKGWRRTRPLEPGWQQDANLIAVQRKEGKRERKA